MKIILKLSCLGSWKSFLFFSPSRGGFYVCLDGNALCDVQVPSSFVGSGLDWEEREAYINFNDLGKITWSKIYGSKFLNGGNVKRLEWILGICKNKKKVYFYLLMYSFLHLHISWEGNSWTFQCMFELLSNENQSILPCQSFPLITAEPNENPEKSKCSAFN